MTPVVSNDPRSRVVTRIGLTDYPPGREILERVLATLREDGIAVLAGFPAEPDVLLRFACRLGRPEPRNQAEQPDLADTTKWVTRVWYRSELPEDAERAYTQGATKLDPHTARAAAPVQPRMLMMLMADPGVRLADTEIDNGQSQFARLDDAVAWLRDNHGAKRAAEVLSTLSRVPISTEEPYPDVPVVAPILRVRGDGEWQLRYWEGIREHAANGETADQVVGALADLDAALAAVRFETVLDAGDLVLLDNDRVTHGRRAFPAWTTGPDGTRVPSSRLIYNLHVFSDLATVRD
ncbi:TauD/TfdA family dioxygenase [Micromonospora sp. NPDC047074]|uniref:TauD/TfdA family dioxygenase n=1 Tax=Micromonospora sp. NPDC047074 TaxID=3154339 RepID=UPI0033D9B927